MENLNNGIKPFSGETEINLLALQPTKQTFETKKYSPWFNAFNFHSWTVTADDPVWGVEAVSDNILNNISVAAGYEYNRNSRASGPYMDVRFGMWYSVLTLGVSSTSREVRTTDDFEYRVVNDRINAGIALPLFYSSGVYQQTV